MPTSNYAICCTRNLRPASYLVALIACINIAICKLLLRNVLPNFEHDEQLLPTEPSKNIRQNFTLSPACLPFHYKRNATTSDNDGSSKSNNNNTAAAAGGGGEEDGEKDFYEKAWTDKAVKRPTRIHFLHMRKAGGTSLLRYFKEIVLSNQTSFTEIKHCEGIKGCLELNDYEDGFHRYYPDEGNVTIKNGAKRRSVPWDDSGTTLYVTHIREPVTRAISHYKYSHRFECPKGGINKMNSLHPVNISTLEDFVQKPNIRLLGKRPARERLWTCSSNCYARWVTGMYNPINVYSDLLRSNASDYEKAYPNIHSYYYKKNLTHNDPNGNNEAEYEMTSYGRMLLEEALKLILRYDLIIVLEWLQSDPDYAKAIEDIFFYGVRGITKKRNAACAEKMKLYNELNPLEVSNDTIQSLRQTNAMDDELYKILTSCG